LTVTEAVAELLFVIVPVPSLVAEADAVLDTLPQLAEEVVAFT